MPDRCSGVPRIRIADRLRLPRQRLGSCDRPGSTIRRLWALCNCPLLPPRCPRVVPRKPGSRSDPRCPLLRGYPFQVGVYHLPDHILEGDDRFPPEYPARFGWVPQVGHPLRPAETARGRQQRELPCSSRRGQKRPDPLFQQSELSSLCPPLFRDAKRLVGVKMIF